VDEIAAFLEVSPAAVKKRLQRARGRLAPAVSDMPTETVSRDFGERIRLHLDLEAGDVAAVRATLDRHPDLVDAPESWTDAEALAAGVPLAHARTPLGRAAARGDLAMVELLLERGATVDARCGCPQGETPLFAAALHDRPAVVRRLLAAGARLDAANAPGIGPREIAELRGYREVARLLGAPEVDAVDRAIAPARARDVVVQTGIKAIDLFAPLGLEALVRVYGAAETGLMVLLAELTRSWGLRGGRSVWTAGEGAPPIWGDLATFAREVGVHGAVTVCDGASTWSALDDARRSGDVALFVFVSEGAGLDVAANLPRMMTAADRVFVVEPWTRPTRDCGDRGDRAPPERPEAPYDAQIVTDPARAGRGVFPAIDVTRTRSRTAVSARHAELRDAWRAQPEAPELDALIAQPFEGWRHQTGVAGASFDLEATLRLVEDRLRRP